MQHPPQRLEARLTTVLFLVTLAIPLLLAGFHIGRDDRILKNGEFRLPAPRPVFAPSMAFAVSFPWQWDEYWRDVFPFRGFFIQLHAKARYKWLGANNPDVIFCDNDYAFGLEEINSFRGKSACSDEELDRFLDLVRRKRDFFREHGIAYYFMLAPNRIRFLREYLPPVIQLPDEHALKTRILARRTPDLEKVLIFPDDVMEYEKQRFPDRPLYFKRDNHWSEWGRVVGAEAFVRAVRRDFPDVPPLDPLVIPFEKALEDASFWSYVRILGVGFDTFPAPDTIKVTPAWSRSYDQLAAASNRASLTMFYASDSFMEILSKQSPEILSFASAERMVTMSIKSPTSSRAVINRDPDIVLESVFIDALAVRYYQGFMRRQEGWFASKQ